MHRKDGTNLRSCTANKSSTRPFKTLQTLFKGLDRIHETHAAEVVKRNKFGNFSSLVKVEMNCWLIESIIVKWDVTDRVF